MGAPGDAYDTHREDSLAYEKIIEEIIDFARTTHSTTGAEATVTKTFAAPFSWGGLLVLLERPLATHPWQEGASQVISQCRTLELLRQGLELASNGLLRFLEDVSVLDRWPMHDETRSSRLTAKMSNQLDELALKAIIAKKPDIILCMGQQARIFLQPHESLLRRNDGSLSSIVYSMHPSYVANHQRQNCHKARRDIYKDIEEACRRLLVASSVRYAVPEYMTVVGNTMPTIRSGTESSDTMAIRQFLDSLVENCITEPQLRPSHCIRVSKDESRSYLTFLDNQKKYLASVCKTRPSVFQDTQQRASCLLIPLLMNLNCTLKRTSYFRAAYNVHWDRVVEILSDPSLDLEGLCWEAGLCAPGTSKDVLQLAFLFDELPFAGAKTPRSKAVERVKRLNFRQTAMENKTWSSPPPRSISSTAHTDLFHFKGNQALTKAFQSAFITSHDCRRCFWKSRN